MLTLQVAPAELEAVLLSHPQVADVGVIGLADPAAGELPLAWIVRKPGATITEKEVEDFVAGTKVYVKYRIRTFLTSLSSGLTTFQ